MLGSISFPACEFCETVVLCIDREKAKIESKLWRRNISDARHLPISYQFPANFAQKISTAMQATSFPTHPVIEIDDYWH